MVTLTPGARTMTPRVHYVARRLLGKHVVAGKSLLCGLPLPREATGHERLVTCRRCRRLLDSERSYHVNGKPATYSEAWALYLESTASLGVRS
jgi:hypothetical protein